jgi:hypothetical protein
MLVVVTFTDDEHFMLVDICQRDWKGIQQQAESGRY